MKPDGPGRNRILDHIVIEEIIMRGRGSFNLQFLPFLFKTMGRAAMTQAVAGHVKSDDDAGGHA
jgi:hypothetical protein